LHDCSIGIGKTGSALAIRYRERQDLGLCIIANALIQEIWPCASPEIDTATLKQQMRAVVQRVSSASVAVEERVVGEIGPGLLVLLGVALSDVNTDADYLAEKIAGLRIFEDENGKMNLSVADVGGAVLAVSQFTLYGDVRRGKRPSFDDAARPERARELYEYFVMQIRRAGLHCETGQFQAMMSVSLVNEGPVTVLLDSSKVI
jgi:D-tyrosyl-tRNA(Tyr) deacylase